MAGHHRSEGAARTFVNQPESVLADVRLGQKRTVHSAAELARRRGPAGIDVGFPAMADILTTACDVR